MAKKRASRLIGFNLFLDTDTDIIQWVNGIPPGMISEYLKDVIRHWLSGQTTPAPKKEIPVEDVAEMFAAMSRKLDELLTRPAVVVGSVQQLPQSPQEDDGLSAEEINERMSNMDNINFESWGA